MSHLIVMRKLHVIIDMIICKVIVHYSLFVNYRPFMIFGQWPSWLPHELEILHHLLKNWFAIMWFKKKKFSFSSLDKCDCNLAISSAYNCSMTFVNNKRQQSRTKGHSKVAKKTKRPRQTTQFFLCCIDHGDVK